MPADPAEHDTAGHPESAEGLDIDPNVGAELDAASDGDGAEDMAPEADEE